MKQTHKILCSGIPLDDGGPQEEYAGIYRQENVMAGFSTFSPASGVPGDMARLMKEFRWDIGKAERLGELEALFLAAKCCHKLVTIHPFLDGDGRTCRLLLDAILLEYAGILVPLGERNEDRSRYLEIASKSNIAGEDDERPWAEPASLILVKANATLRKWKERILDTPV